MSVSGCHVQSSLRLQFSDLSVPIAQIAWMSLTPQTGSAAGSRDPSAAISFNDEGKSAGIAGELALRRLDHQWCAEEG
jgi:hypothetical protein